MNDTLFLLLFATCIILCFFFSGSETGILTADRITLSREEKSGSRSASRLIRFLDRKDTILATLLIGNNLSNISISALTTSYLSDRFGAKAPLIAISIVTPTILVFGELIPKALYMAYGNRLLKVSHGLISFCTLFFRPVAEIAMILPRLMAPSRKAVDVPLTREDLHVLVKTGAVVQEVGQDERMMISRLLGMRDRRVVKAMMPIGDVAMIPDTAVIRDAHRVIRKHGVSRLPVFHERSDTIVGIVQATDLLRSTDPLEPVAGYVKKPYFVPEQKAIFQLLEESFREQAIAVVIDEYGLATGIITMEDMVEEIMGDILDEYDVDEPVSYQLKSGSHVVDSRISIKEFNEKIAPVLPSGDFLTLSGFLSARMQKIPQVGDVCEFGPVRFVILEASAQRPGRIVVHISQEHGHRNEPHE